jgi:MarR family transcriptional regulator for hemolysin
MSLCCDAEWERAMTTDRARLERAHTGALPQAGRRRGADAGIGIHGVSDPLGAAGFATRPENPDHRRAKVLGLTAGGFDAIARVEGDLAPLRRSVSAGASRADREAGPRVLRAVQRCRRCQGAAS